MIREVDEGLIIRLKIVPNSSKNDIILEEDFIKIKITAESDQIATLGGILKTDSPYVTNHILHTLSLKLLQNVFLSVSICR